MSPLILSAALVVFTSTVVVLVGATLAMRQRRRSWESIEKGLQRTRGLETELEDIRASMLAVAERHMPPDKTPKTTMEALIAIDGLLCAQAQENQVLHRRLIDAIRSEHSLHQTSLALREKVDLLEKRLSEAPKGDFDLLALQRQTESLRGELRSAQRLIQALEAQLRSVEEEHEAIEGLPCDITGETGEPVSEFFSAEDRTDPMGGRR
jgi:hypothetical protein